MGASTAEIVEQQTDRRRAAHEAIRNALTEISTDSTVIETQDGDLGVVFLDDGFALIVSVEPAGLVVLN